MNFKRRAINKCLNVSEKRKTFPNEIMRNIYGLKTIINGNAEMLKATDVKILYEKHSSPDRKLMWKILYTIDQLDKMSELEDKVEGLTNIINMEIKGKSKLQKPLDTMKRRDGQDVGIKIGG